MNQRIYLDNNASCPLDPRVKAYLIDLLPSLGGNPSSIHVEGRAAKALITKSRDLIASYLKVKPQELYFTSGGTESVNTAMRGLCALKPRGRILTSTAEHSCVIEMCRQLESAGHPVDFLSPGSWGAITSESIEAGICEDTCLIALMAVNNETGVKTDISAIAKIAYKRNIPLFVDAVAQLGKEPVEIPQGVSAMAFSAHKLHALQGCGLLFVRKGVKWSPLIIGGEQEYSKRAGTENLLGIASFSKAIELLENEGLQPFDRLNRLRMQFETILLSKFPTILINGEGPRISNVSNLFFPGVDGETLLYALDREGIAASLGSACSSGSLEPSRVLRSMELSHERVCNSIRFSFSRMTTQEEIEIAARIIGDLYSQALRRNSD